MNIRLPRIALGLVVLTGAAGLSVTNEADSYATLGFNLGTGQRDFRVHNDFSDSASNNNQTPDPNWPSYQGVDMSMWKAGAEWGSRNFGDGSGDPTQNAVGDGGVLVDDCENPDAWVARIERVLDDEHRYEALSAAARENTRRAVFEPAACARALRDVCLGQVGRESSAVVD